MLWAGITGNFSELDIVNLGTVTGLFSLDNVNWAVLPAGSTVVIENPKFQNATIYIQNTSGGSNLSGVWAFAYQAP